VSAKSATAIPFALVDVFTEVPLAGNPLAVVLYVAGLDERVLPRLAREFNQSETTFLFPPTRAEADWRLRSFTAAGIEVFGAGHNALGAWWWLAATGRLRLEGAATNFHQELGSNVLPLTVYSREGRVDAVAMTQSALTFGQTVSRRSELAAALRLDVSDLVYEPVPAQVVATDVAHLMVPVRREALSRARPVEEALAAFVLAHGGEGCYLFTLEPSDATAAADTRFFNPGVGIGEDPATGTAAGPLAALLVHHGIVTGPRIVIDQGRATGRPSRLEVHVNGSHIELRGAAVVTAEGSIRIG
jgi:trans-2,3-dihydro-3-hydroxyanthranilate isomerase